MPDNEKLLPSKDEYLKKEFDKLNSELSLALEETRSREKYSLTIIAGTAVWLFTNFYSVNYNLLKAISSIPIITTIIYGFSVVALFKNIKWIGEYLDKIENYFLQDDKDGFGWNKYFRKDTNDRIIGIPFKNKRGMYLNSTVGIWVLQILFASFLFVLVCLRGDLKKEDKPKEKCTSAQQTGLTIGWLWEDQSAANYYQR